MPTLASGDAIGNDAFELQRLFWRRGVRSEIFVEEAKPEVRAFARPWRELRAERPDGGPLLLHLSMGNDAVDEIAQLPFRMAVVYHNITPARFFSGLNAHAEKYAEIGRRQLRDLAAKAELGIADSEYNRRELEELGYARTAVVPIIVDWSAFDLAPDATVMRALAEERTSIVTVGQVLPQKAIHDVVAGFARYRERDRGARLYVVGSTAMSAQYLERLRADVDRLGLGDSVTFTGSVPIESLVAYYRGATALLTLSDHEGFCVPLLEAMRSDLPIVAHDAGAIPETLGDAGILLRDKSPDRVAEALERAVGDRELRRDLIAKGRARLDEFAPDRVAQRLRDALALAGWDLREPRTRRVVVLSSGERSGIYHYALSVADGLRQSGHEVTFVGVRHLDAKDLAASVSRIARDTEAVIVEHEHGIFSDVPFVRALISLWRRKIPVVLSLHEVEPEKFHHFRMLSNALHYRARYGKVTEFLRVPWVALRIANWFVRYRAVLALTGGIPAHLIVHSHRSNHWLSLLTDDPRKREMFPLVVVPLEDTVLPADAEAKRALRERLGLPADKFVFVSPGFFFRRKRFAEVIAAAPPDSVVVLSGTRSANEPEYFDEVQAFIRERGFANVVVNSDYATMGQYVAASDCVVLYYEDVFQSAVAAQAVWAGLPCIFSDAKGFDVYRGAGLVARDGAELADAMREIQRPETYARLRAGVRHLRRRLSPERSADRHLTRLP
ncbi:MAG TPA: glycosyltransferase [Candidatus Limnocylindria bacterium]|nr:glycosyltransferase [Candidatus Limnocylindria bacterium]